MRRTLFLLLGVALLSTPGMAANDEFHWYIGVEGSSVQVSNADVVLGIPADPDCSPITVFGCPAGEFVDLDFGTSTAVGGHLGMSDAWGDLTLSFWNYDEDDRLTAEDVASGFLPAFPNPELGDPFAERLDGASSLDTTTVDLTWSRPMVETDRSTWKWIVGIRSWELEQESVMATDLDPATPLEPIAGIFDDLVVMRSDADGIGLLIGLGSSFRFNPRLTGSTSFKMAFLTGSLDAIRGEDAFGDIIVSTFDDSDRNYRQMELEARLTVNFVAGFDGFVGYQFKQYDDASINFQFVDEFVPDSGTGVSGIVRLGSSNLSFGGVSFGLGYRF